MRRQVRRPTKDVQVALEQLHPVCPGCGRPFTRVWPKQKHCSPDCRRPKRAPGLFDKASAGPL